MPPAPIGNGSPAGSSTTNVLTSFFSLGDLIHSDLLFAQAEFDQFLQESSTQLQPAWLTQLLTRFQQQATVGPLAKLIKQGWLDSPMT